MIYRHASYTAGSERSLLSDQSFRSHSKRIADVTTASSDAGASSAAVAATGTHDDFGEIKVEHEQELGQDPELDQEQEQGEQEALPADELVKKESHSDAGDHT